MPWYIPALIERLKVRYRFTDCNIITEESFNFKF